MTSNRLLVNGQHQASVQAWLVVCPPKHTTPTSRRWHRWSLRHNRRVAGLMKR